MAEQNSFFRDCPLLVVASVKLVRIQTTGVVSLLIVDVHLNLGQKWEQNTVYKKNETIRSLLLLFRFLICFYVFLVLFFYFFGIERFATKTFEKFGFQSKISLFQIKVIFSIRLYFKNYPIFIK